jgi:hypothetical protein
MITDYHIDIIVFKTSRSGFLVVATNQRTQFGRKGNK